MSSVSVNNNLVSYKRLRNLFLGLFIFATSCGKIENEIVDTSYARSDIVAAEAAFTLINSNLMATENNYPGATCNMSSTYKDCNSGAQAADVAWTNCTFNFGTIIPVVTSGVYGPWFEDYQNNTCTLNNTESVLRYTDRLNNATLEKAKYIMPNQDIIEMSNDGGPQSFTHIGITIKKNASNPEREIGIATMRMTRKSQEGNLLYDVYVKTGNAGDLDIKVNGTLAGQNRVVNGPVLVYNGDSEDIQVVFDNATWGKSPCCYPTQGSMDINFTRGPNVGKTSTVNFTSSCGSAEITGVNGEKSALNFTECY